MLAYNDKRTLENVTVPFRAAITNFLGNNARAGELLAALNLQRVFVLTSGSTCSASESFINSLLGVDMQVILIGGTTCGKPYGSSRDDNCTLSYFAIEFEGRNHKGAVTPVTGITPTCAVNDDLDRPLGDPSERMLGAALTWQSTGACPVTTAIRAAVPVVGVVGVTGSVVGTTMTEKKRDWVVTSSPLDSIKLIRKQP